MNQSIIYEQPLNERIRTFLRLEFLFAQASHHLHQSSQWDSRSTLSSTLDILSIFGRTDLKTEVLKELERNAAILTRLEPNPEIDQTQLKRVLSDLEMLAAKLHKCGGPIGADLKKHEFLTSIQQRTAIPGGTCDFDLPAYHFWLQRPADERKRDLASWLGRFDAIAQAIQLILKLIRESTVLKPATAQNGFFQKTLDSNHPCQLVRVAVQRDVPYHAEISGGRHRFTVRFLESGGGRHRFTVRFLESARPDGHTRQANRDIEFQLGCCVI